VIDDQNLDRSLCRLELESELLLHGGIDGGDRVGIG
jgi:hypothetical protein